MNTRAFSYYESYYVLTQHAARRPFRSLPCFLCTRVKFYFTKGGGLPVSSRFQGRESLFDSLPCNHES